MFTPTVGIVSGITKALETNASVEYFTIVGEYELLNDESTYAIAVMMKRNTSIISIRLHCILVTQSAHRVLADALLTNTSVRTFVANALIIADTAIPRSIHISVMRNRILLVDTMFHPRSILHRLPIELHERIVWLAMEQYIRHVLDQLAMHIHAHIANAKSQTRPT